MALWCVMRLDSSVVFHDFTNGKKAYVLIRSEIYEFLSKNDNLYFFSSGNGLLASWGCILGFIVMMSLDVGLG